MSSNIALTGNLCKGLRAVGLPKRVTLALVNKVSLWQDKNGLEWTCERLKGYKQWYLSYLTGEPQPAPWCKHGRDNLPLDEFKYLFEVKNQAKVLAALSIPSLYEARGLTDTQREKFTSALAGGTFSRVDALDLHRLGHLSEEVNRTGWIKVPELGVPTPNDITGISVPVGRRVLHIDPKEELLLDAKRAEALVRSWETVPQETLTYLDRTDRLDLVPDAYSDIVRVPDIRATGRPVGRIGLLQEPGLKLRSIANPHRVAQYYTLPLAKVWERAMVCYPSDCTFDQERGVRWVQEKLTAGVRLSGSDLSSATDLLELENCIRIANAWTEPMLEASKENRSRYDEAVDYFRDLSRGVWVTPESSGLGDVQWKQGQPLGLYPSFRLLALTNNGIGTMAAISSGCDPSDSFRVIGDDIIMVSSMAEEYTRRIREIGGKVNLGKTLTSDKVAEFAGRIITPTRVMRKTYQLAAPGDNSFMSYVSDLGEQASGLLRPRQRKAWDTFKYVPGVAYDGPWNPNSGGFPLSERVGWSELALRLSDSPLDPDRATRSYQQQMLRAVLEVADRDSTRPDEVRKLLPWPVDEDFQSSFVSSLPIRSGDPRLKDGKSFLVVLEELATVTKNPQYQDFKSWREDPGRSCPGPEQEEMTTPSQVTGREAVEIRTLDDHSRPTTLEEFVDSVLADEEKSHQLSSGRGTEASLEQEDLEL